MSTENDRPASDVFTIIEEPVAQGARAAVLRFASRLLGFPVKKGTHPVLVEKQTGKRVQDHSAADFMWSHMHADLEGMSAQQFRARYIDS